MSRLPYAVILAIGMGIGAASGYWYARSPIALLGASAASEKSQAADRKIIYYRDPSGAPFWSATPKQDAQGRDYRPVYEDEEISFDPKPAQPKAAQGERKILYYRNPMGLPDTSPVPKKDWMGMDYIPVYEGEEQDDGKTVKVSLDKIQRSGVRTETVQSRVIVQSVRAVGTVEHDESRQTIVTLRADGYIEDLFVNKTGQHVHAGEPLFRVYIPELQRAQVDLNSAVRAPLPSMTRSDAEGGIDGAMQRLRNLGVPESRIREVRDHRTNPRTIDWPSPATGDVVEKDVINGQRVAAGDKLYLIADHSQVWVIADVAEGDIAAIRPGTHARITFRAYPAQPVDGEVTFIYPEMKAETRTVRVRLEVSNPDGQLRPDMYADVVFGAGSDGQPVVSVPASAIIDSGTRQVVLISKGDGRFEPRPVKLGRRGDGYVEVTDGIKAGEEVVTSATFLIDAESNLRAALQAFTQPEAAQ